MSISHHVAPAGFVPGNERLNRMLADPETARRVADVRAEMERDNDAYRTGLAALRRAEHLTQQEMAQRLGVSQPVISRMEQRDDMLLSTLTSYLRAAGADHIAIVATIDGRKVKLRLDTWGEPA